MARPPLVLETWGHIRKGTKDGVPFAVANYRDSDGVTRRMQRTGKTEPAAERALLQALKARLAPAGLDLTPDSRVSDLAKMWLEETEQRDLASGTLVIYRNTVLNHIIKGIGDVRLREAGVPRLDRFIKTVADKRGPSAARLARVCLMGMFGLAARHGAVRGNPVRDVASVPRMKRPVVAPTVEDVPKIRARFAEWDAGVDAYGRPRTTDLGPVADMLAATGARTGEVLAITWDDVDLSATPATVTIRRTIALGDDARLRVQDKPKSDTSNRVLKLHPAVAHMLVRRRVESLSEFVFPSTAGTFRSPNNFRTQWRRALLDTEFAGVTPKSFRKTVATVLRDTLGVGAAKDQLGHSSEQITNQHYVAQAHEGPDATGVLDALFEG